MLLFRRGRWEESEELFRKALSLSPRSFDAHFLLGSLLNLMEKFSEAKEILQKAMNLAGSDKNLHHRAASELFSADIREEDYSTIREMAKEELERNPESFEAWLELAYRFEGKGLHFGAAGAGRRALELWPDSHDGKVILSRSLISLHKNTEAEVIIRQITETRPNDPRWWAMLGFVLLRQNRDEEALAALDRSLELDSRNADVTYNKVCVLCRLGNTDDALRFLEKAIGLNEMHRRIAANDIDLAPLRNNPKFLELLSPRPRV